jgi:hypothetical protein
MKTIGNLIIMVSIFAIGFVGGIIAEHYRAEHYEFHVGTGAAVGYIWRMDHHTGKVEISFGSHGWHTIPEAKPWEDYGHSEKSLTNENSITNAPAVK